MIIKISQRDDLSGTIYRIYKRDGSKIAEGSSPLKIIDIEPNTQVNKGDYYLKPIQENGMEGVKIDIPEFKTGVITPDNYFIGNNYVTGRYEGITPNKISLIVNDERQKIVKLSEELTSNKQFRYYKQGIKVSDQVKVTLYYEHLELGTSNVVLQSAYSMNMTANEMKAILDEKNISYKSNASKKELLTLLEETD